MGNQSRATKDARRLEKLYGTKAHGTTHSTVLRLISERGLEGAIRQLEDWGMRPAATEEAKKTAEAPGAVATRVEFRPDDGFPICDGFMVGPDDGVSTLYPTPEEAVAAHGKKPAAAPIGPVQK